MVSIGQIRSSNARIAEYLPAGLVAVFAGGTSGIGESTMKQFARHAVQPRIYFIGRSDNAAARISAELTAINPAGKYRFIRADLSLLHNVDDVCREIKTKESYVNLLFLTPGTLLTGKGKIPLSAPSHYTLPLSHQHTRGIPNR
jgi:NADP-dependent 3-hydroxy acid dehydrogenase YdfG